jgi:PPOX class probable F420-dependent enzyme
LIYVSLSSDAKEEKEMPIKLSENTEVSDFIDSQTTVHFSTLMKDGSPQVSPVGLGRDGDYICVNTAEGTLKARNVRRDPRVALSIHAPDPASGLHSFMLLRGRVVEILDGAAGRQSLFRLMTKMARLKGRPLPSPPASADKVEPEDISKIFSDAKKAGTASASETVTLPHDESRIGLKIEIDHIHHFLLHGRGVLVSITEAGERSSAVNDAEHHQLWKKA